MWRVWEEVEGGVYLQGGNRVYVQASSNNGGWVSQVRKSHKEEARKSSDI